ncbi:hypothetical protein ANACOL_02188 [Anaerotruncus colihominis DSM 17241]|uniref:Uncharacterized protein n=1 Tax=Anaerotruncus colihominis DSM 17241 TaxID=445972 RepID=B0PBN0_9FIRM|nr:hypothetical protein ANACOL_02188 [Anaerotruncus colihominis DSM 17241]
MSIPLAIFAGCRRSLAVIERSIYYIIMSMQPPVEYLKES